jgi:hypothetical protein
VSFKYLKRWYNIFMSLPEDTRGVQGFSPPTNSEVELQVYRAALHDVDALLQPLLQDARNRLLGSSALHDVEATIRTGRANERLFTDFATAVLPRISLGEITTHDAFEAKIIWSRMLVDNRSPQFVVGSKPCDRVRQHTDIVFTTPVLKNSTIATFGNRPVVSMYHCATDDYNRWRDLSDRRLIADISYEDLRSLYDDETGQYTPQNNAIRISDESTRLVFGGPERREKDLIRRGLIARPAHIFRDLDRRELAGLDLAAFDVGKHMTSLAVDFNKTAELAGVMRAYSDGMQSDPGSRT